ncbi:MAG: site-specific DNA-methyltransferase [Euryarchaeota archaeon]|nr:site-specific DNA-methyltransferase [Euryarchaeota archaeon]MBT4981984.1 site-specific DNA-methyltransferase [Euryarchaeota archaeon]MBT5184552.1 site-specific DNA-methyltransferase [Euryarchaeota archaeon]
MARENPLEGPRKRAKTTTSSFGVSKREGHDSSVYYGARMYDDLVSQRDVGETVEFPPELENLVINGDSKSMPIPDNCVHLVVTSPPYNASKAYDEDLSLAEYLSLLHEVFAECYRVLAPGGRMVVNVANLGRKPYIPLSSHINLIMHEIGFMHRGEVIWDKSASAGSSCAWGSFQSASNPCLRDIHEYLLLFSKGDYKLPRTKNERAEGRIDTIGRDEFIQQTKSIWSFPTESAKRVNHPAPFPVELPKRCIEMFTFTGDVVLDPFLGSGTTAVAAKMSGRKYIGCDLSAEYCAIAEDRLAMTEAYVPVIAQSE